MTGSVVKLSEPFGEMHGTWSSRPKCVSIAFVLCLTNNDRRCSSKPAVAAVRQPDETVIDAFLCKTKDCFVWCADYFTATAQQ